MTNIMVIFYSIQQFDTIHFRHHNVTDHDIRHFCHNLFQSGTTVGRFQYPIFPLQDMHHKTPQLLIVFHNQHRNIFLCFTFFLTFRFRLYVTRTIVQNKFYILVAVINLCIQGEADTKRTSLPQCSIHLYFSVHDIHQIADQ